MLSSTPWWYSVEKSFSPISFGELRVGLEVGRAQRREAHAGRTRAPCPTLAMSCPVLSMRRTLVELEFSMSSLRTELMAQ